MRHVPLDQLLMQQTLVIQELGLYLSDARYLPRARDFFLLEDIAFRAKDTADVCRYLEVEFFKRKRLD